MNGLSRDDIIRMAREADLPPCHTTHPKALERFAHLVAAAEREACAVMINILQKSGIGEEHLVEAIRERGAP